MAIRENPSWQLFVALGLLLMGMFIGCEAIDRPSEEGGVTTARPLRPRSSPIGKGRASRTQQAAASVVFIACGLGLGVYGVRQLRHQGELLRDGVPVIGRITRIEHTRKRSSQIIYRFQDDHGREHEGVYFAVLAGSPLDDFREGDEITVIYDPADASRHMLDVDNVRRADAVVRRL
jgi:Protein of unknown function (DUF3592)